MMADICLCKTGELSCDPVAAPAHAPDPSGVSCACAMVRPAGRRGIATRPFTFAQDHIGQAQKADLGRLVQVQLPSSSGANGDPATDWKFRNEVSGPVPLIRTAQVKSPARIDGFDIMTVFEFMLSPAAGARTVIASEPDNLISPTGVYTILLHPLN